MKSDNGAKHFSNGKPPLGLLSRTAKEALARVLEYGNLKYPDDENGVWNWYRGMNWSELLGSIHRHADRFAAGEDFDRESGLPHVDHIQACSHFLSTYFHEGRGQDDRQLQLPLVELKRGEPDPVILARMLAAIGGDPEPEIPITVEEPAPIWTRELMMVPDSVDPQMGWTNPMLGKLAFRGLSQNWWWLPPDEALWICTGFFGADAAKEWVAHRHAQDLAESR